MPQSRRRIGDNKAANDAGAARRECVTSQNKVGATAAVLVIAL